MYKWKGLKKIDYRNALELFSNKAVYLLYEDNTESQANNIDEIKEHYNNGGEFGIEKTLEERIIEKLYDFWNSTDDNSEKLLQEITDNINDGINGIENLLDWCRCDYDMCQDKYRALHNLSEEEMEKIMEENFGSYEFMYDEVPYVSWLEDIWDLCKT